MRNESETRGNGLFFKMDIVFRGGEREIASSQKASSLGQGALHERIVDGQEPDADQIPDRGQKPTEKPKH